MDNRPLRNRHGWDGRVFSTLLFVYPKKHRARYAEDMCATFGDELRAVRAGRASSVIWFWTRTLWHVFLFGLGERLASFARGSGDATRSLVQRGRSTRRPAPQPLHPGRGGGWWDGLRLDLKFALRGLRRNPGFTVVTVLTLVVGIGNRIDT